MKAKKKIKIIYAAGLHSGGGLFILNYLRKKIFNKEDIFFLDERLKLDKFYKNLNIIFVKDSFFSKFYSELKIKLFYDKNKNNIIFLNGLPPFFKFKNYVISYFQNANILTSKRFFSTDNLRSIKFRFFKKNVDKWVVFSRYAKKMLKKKIQKREITYQKIILKNFRSKLKKKYDFIYPASGEDHKNHENLIKAFIILSKNKIFPRLLLTLKKSEFTKLNIQYYKKKYKLKIINKPYQMREKFMSNYSYSKALIFPSYTETLGLPLLEAKSYGIAILASNRNFAKEYTKKNMLFEPDNPKDLAKKIINYYQK